MEPPDPLATVLSAIHARITNLLKLFPIENALRSVRLETSGYRLMHAIVWAQITRDLAELSGLLNSDEYVRAPSRRRVRINRRLDGLIPLVGDLLAAFGVDRLGKSEPS